MRERENLDITLSLLAGLLLGFAVKGALSISLFGLSETVSGFSRAVTAGYLSGIASVAFFLATIALVFVTFVKLRDNAVEVGNGFFLGFFLTML